MYLIINFFYTTCTIQLNIISDILQTSKKNIFNLLIKKVITNQFLVSHG